MRVLLLNYEYPPNGGGAGVATEMLARAPRRARCRRRCRDRGRAAHPSRGCCGTASRRRRGCYGHRVQMPAHVACTRRACSTRRAICSRRCRDVRRLLPRHRYDVVHFFFSLPTGALLPLLDLRDAPVVVSLRGSDVPGLRSAQSRAAAAHRLLRPLTRWIWRRADRVVAVARAWAAWRGAPCPGLRYSVVPGRRGPRALPPARRRCAGAGRRGPLPRRGASGRAERPGRPDRRVRAAGARPLSSSRSSAPGRTRRRSASGSAAGPRGQVRFTGWLEPGRGGAAGYRAADLFTLAPSGGVVRQRVRRGARLGAADRGEHRRRHPRAGRARRQRAAGPAAAAAASWRTRSPISPPTRTSGSRSAGATGRRRAYSRGTG